MAVLPFIFCRRQHLTDEWSPGPTSVTCLWGPVWCGVSCIKSVSWSIQHLIWGAYHCKPHSKRLLYVNLTAGNVKWTLQAHCRAPWRPVGSVWFHVEVMALTVSRLWIIKVTNSHNFLIQESSEMYTLLNSLMNAIPDTISSCWIPGIWAFKVNYILIRCWCDRTAFQGLMV